MRALTIGCLLLTLWAAGVQAQDEAADLQRRIATERAAVDARFAAESSACRQGFAVTACLDDARRRHRQAVAALQAELRALDEAKRRRKADERQAAVARKQAEVARRLASAASVPTVASAPSAAASRPPPAVAPARAAASEAAARAAARAEAARRLQAEIKADQARIRDRIDKRAAQGKQPLPLPPAPAASAPH